MPNYSDRGIPIVPLNVKLDYLRSCMLGGHDEDAMGHLFDLIHHIAPGYKFSRFDGIKAICDYYGEHPTPILEAERC